MHDAAGIGMDRLNWILIRHERLAQLDGDLHKTSLARTRALRLLGLLEQKVLLDGKDPFVLAAITSARREMLPGEGDPGGRDT